MTELGDSIDESVVQGTGCRVCLSCGRRFDPGEQVCPEDGTALSPAQEKDAFLGKTIAGKYKMVSLLGQGGMSIVYKAEQMPIKKIVAVKMLMAHLSHDEGSVRRFYQEAMAAAKLSHPNVVNVFEWGVTEEHQPFLVMDYLEGETLGQIIKSEGKIHYKRAIPLFIEVCAGLGAAHAQGIVHRDVKPGNIVLQDLAEGEVVRIVDFGIAKMIDTTESQHLTKTGEVFGSPLYMSPEQCEGRALDGRSDMYSLGVVMYESLSGHPPIMGANAIETMRMHLHEMPESLRKSNAQIPLDLENVIFKMMAKDPEKRYKSMLEVKRELEQIGRGETTNVGGNILYVQREFSRRRKIIFSACVSVGVFILVGLFAYPKVLAVMAGQEYDKGEKEIQSGNDSKAEPYLKSAVDLSRQIGDSAGQSRALALLIGVYSRQRRMDLLHQTRHERQALIKSNLRRYGISDSEFEDVVGVVASKAGVPESYRAAREEADVSTRKRKASFEPSDNLVEGEDKAASNQIAFDQDKKQEASPRRRQVTSGGAGGQVSFSQGASISVTGDSFSGRGFSAPANSDEQQRHIAIDTNTLDRLEMFSDVLAEKGDFDKAERAADVAIPAYQELYGGSGGELARLYVDRAWSRLNLQDKQADAYADATQAVRIGSAAEARGETAEAKCILAICALKKGDRTQAAQLFAEAERDMAASNEKGHVYLATVEAYATALETSGFAQDAEKARRSRK